MIANGDLFVGYADGDYGLPPYNGVILEYVNNNSAKWYNGGVLSSTPVTVASVNVAGLACDASGNLYEVDGDDGNVYEFANNSGTLSSTRTLYASGLGATCEAINLGEQTAVAPKPNLYVTDGSHNLIYSFNTTNGAATQTLFSGAGLAEPRSAVWPLIITVICSYPIITTFMKSPIIPKLCQPRTQFP